MNKSKRTQPKNNTRSRSQAKAEDPKQKVSTSQPQPLQRNQSQARGKNSASPDSVNTSPIRNKDLGTTQNDVAFPQGSFIAFVDPSGNLDDFKLGHLVQDFRENEDEAIVDVYEESAPLTYKKVATKHPVTDQCIICDTKATAQQGKKKNDVLQKINKQQCNKILKLMAGVVQKLQEEASEEDEKDEEEQSESEQEAESEEEKDSSQVIRGRRMVKAKRPISKQDNKLAQPPSKIKSKEGKGKIQASKKSSRKSGGQSVSKPKEVAKRGKKQLQNEKMEEDKDEEMINTSKTRSRKSKDLSSIVPKIGQKRKRLSDDLEMEEEGDDEQDEGDSFREPGDNSEESRPVKKRKLSQGKQQDIKQSKPKKAKKMPTEFKKGKWNPNIQLVERDLSKTDPTSNVFLECCIRCNNRNVHRAAETGNLKLLQKAIEAKKNISLLTAFWGPDVTETAIDIMIKNNQHEMLEALMHPKLRVPQHSTYQRERDNSYSSRIANPQYLLSQVDSGMVSKMAYGARIRKVQMTRGNRQGNNAFLQYQDNDQKNPVYYIHDEDFLKKVLYSQSMDVKTFQVLYKLEQGIENTINSNVYEVVRAGNRAIAFEIINTFLVKYPNWGFNNLHAASLGDDKDMGNKILKQSVTKKANTNKNITPLHCSCINPDPYFLKTLLDANPDFEVLDDDMRRPVHYAGACESPEPLKHLIQVGAALNSVDNQKKNCLHIAAMLGRHENVRALMETSPTLAMVKDKLNMIPLGYACKFGHLETVKLFSEFKFKVNAGIGQERLPPLSWAACYGHYELCEFLLDNKARVLSKDKFKRTPLTMAVRNGHTRVASLLLQRGAEWDHPDSSMNTPLHYAAAYGWIECIELLLSAGADINSINSWKITPINIAMLKNHQGCVKKLLDQPNVDVNCKDEKGRTLLMLSLVLFDEDSCEFIKYLLEKGADVNMADLEGLTPLHYCAKYKVNDQLSQMYGLDAAAKKVECERLVKLQTDAVKLLISHNADLTLKNGKGKTPFAICLENDNTDVLKLLQDKVSLNKEPELFFSFTQKIFNVEYQKVLKRLIENEEPLPETINTLDPQGFTPFLAYIKSFVDYFNHYQQQIKFRVNHHSATTAKKKIVGQIQNKDLFDPLADQSKFYHYNENISEVEKTEMTNQVFQKIISKPFLEIISYLVEHGADPQAQVQKLKKYRDQEMKNKELFDELQENEAMLKAKEEEKILKREEVLRERRLNGHRRHQNGAHPVNPYGGNSFNDADTTQDKYETRDGKKVIREYSGYGLQNALHLVLAQPDSLVFELLLELKVDTDLPDYDETTPFNLMTKSFYQNYHPKFRDTLQKFLQLEVRIDYPDIKGRTPFLNLYQKSEFENAYQLLELGANVNQMDTSGMFALKYALVRRQDKESTKLLGYGANINQIDNKGRNLLHHAINMSSATADATFESEQFLISRGVELNHRDQHNRTPLHYAFVKIQNWKTNTQIDPIETVSSLCGCKGLEIDVPDKWLKTPLHYASQRGASTCAMYLVKRGADLEKKDIYGNTALGLGLKNGHYNYGIIMIQKGSQVLPKVFNEDHEKLAKKWKMEEKLRKKGDKARDLLIQEQDIEMQDEESDPEKKQFKKHRNLFENGNGFHDYSSCEEESQEDNYGDEDSLDYQQETLQNQMNPFRSQVYAVPKTNYKSMSKPASTDAWGFNNQHSTLNFGQGHNETNQQNLVKSDNLEEGVSMFKLSIRAGQQGLAYLMLDSGFDLMHAMQDAMDEKKFLLVLTLLSKNPNDEVIQSKNDKGQNLFHILSMYASSCSAEHLKRIYDALIQRGVDCRAKDKFQRTALHYSVIDQATQMVQLLLDHADGHSVNEVDVDNQTPFTYCIRGDKSKNLLYSPQQLQKTIFQLLAEKGADVNVQYPEKDFKPAFSEEEVDENYADSYQPKGPYLSTPLINVIRQESSFTDVMRNNIIGLMENGAKLNIVDSDGRDPIMYAVMQNNKETLKMLLDNISSGNVNQDCQDKAGKSAVHYVVCPLKFGSYENTQMLKSLHLKGFNMSAQDAQGKTPIAYAQDQESGVMLKQIANLLNQDSQLLQVKRQISSIPSQNWPESCVDFEDDADVYMKLAQEKEEQDAKDKKNRVPVDVTGQFEQSYQVYYEKEKPWDIYLVKVNLKNGVYGEYLFYKMQLLFDVNRELYVVFTRWGRIGETGMNQRTPFHSAEEAKEDFNKIFKTKTGGQDFDQLEAFEKQKKKYNVAKVNYVSVNFKDYLAPFDFEKCPKSGLEKPIYELFEEISNITMYQKAMNTLGIDTTVLPFSDVKKDVIVEAKQILMDINEAVNEGTELSKLGMKADYESLLKNKEKISELSSSYYELIPHTQYRNQVAPPLQHLFRIKQQFQNLDTLSNIEQASKILLGALYKQKTRNPVDYVFDALNLKVEALPTSDPEFDVINQYMKNTSSTQFNHNMMGDLYQQNEIVNIFKVQRKGEAETMQAYKDLPNHFLLYHGSQMFNFLGILKQGLRITPPEAPIAGDLFGKGVYFADMFDKSKAYSGMGYVQQDSFIVMLCEVALGKSKELYGHDGVEKLESKYQSVKGIGREGPDYDSTIVLPNGVKIPFGKRKEYFKNDQQKQTKVMLQNNEFVVYNTSQVRMRYLIQFKVKKPQVK